MLGQYECVYLPNHPRAIKSNGCVYLHFLVVEEKLGRSLKKEEFVHHIDENKLNNSPDNLIVFKTNADHIRFHHTGILISEEDYFISPQQEKTCPLCGNSIDRDAIHCKKCDSLLKRKVERPNREELKNLIRENTFCAIGRMYGVSDNSIRKWCDSYNLPRRIQDIKNYSNEEWLLI